MDVLDLVRNHILHGAALKQLTLLDGVENRKVGEVLGQNFDKFLEV